MAITLPMHTIISPGQWQPWIAVSPLLGPIGMAYIAVEFTSRRTLVRAGSPGSVLASGGLLWNGLSYLSVSPDVVPLSLSHHGYRFIIFKRLWPSWC